MNRRKVLRLTIAASVAVGGGAVAMVFSNRVQWTTRPSITVICSRDDSRLPLVSEAVGYWNQTLSEAGTPFRLGDVAVVHGVVPEDDVLALGPTWRPTLPNSLASYAGDILVVLSDASFISLAAPRGRRVVVAIKTQNDPRMTPAILRNVIAHELGHAIGLDHNANSMLLMCGRPAACRPGRYDVQSPRFFPLSTEEKERLRELYPVGWAGGPQ